MRIKLICLLWLVVISTLSPVFANLALASGPGDLRCREAATNSMAGATHSALAPEQLLGVRGLATRQVRHRMYSSERANARAAHIPRCPGQPLAEPKRCEPHTPTIAGKVPTIL